MRRIKLRSVESEGFDLGVDTSDQLSLAELTKHHPKPRKAKQIVVAPQPNDLPDLYPHPHFHPHVPYRKDGFLSKLGRALTLFRNVTFCISLVTAWPGVATVVASACAGIAVWVGGYELNKAPKNEAGQTISKLDAAKKGGILERTKEKIKDLAGEPMGAVKETAKHGVEKAAARVEEVKEKVDDAKEKAVEKVDELKTAIVGAKVEAPAQPGILEQATSKVAAIPAAITSSLPQGMTPEQVKRAEEQQRVFIKRQKDLIRRNNNNHFVDGVLGRVNYMTGEMTAAQIRNQREAELQHQWNQIKAMQFNQQNGVYR